MGLIQIYETLLGSFGPQGWWPVGGKGGKFSPPELEVCVGAILTQNTGWNNVEKALANMKSMKIKSMQKLMNTDIARLEEAIRPSGLYRQKAERLRTLSGFITAMGGFRQFSKKVTREQLLDVKGLGPETVDSIMLYALNRPVFVIDAYTKRVFSRLGFNLGEKRTKFWRPVPKRPREEYELWRWFFESGLPSSSKSGKQASSHASDQVSIYKEFHALIVELAKRHCKARPDCNECPLDSHCRKNI